MKNQKVCFSRSFVFVFLSIIILGTFTILSIKLLQTRTSSSTRAESYSDRICSIGYANAARCSLDCGRYYPGNQCVGTPALHCCPIPTPTEIPSPLTNIPKFNLDKDQMNLLTTAGFTPIKQIPDEYRLNWIGPNDTKGIEFYGYPIVAAKMNEEGLKEGTDRGGRTIPFANMEFIGMESFSSRGDNAGLLEVLVSDPLSGGYFIDIFTAKIDSVNHYLLGFYQYLDEEKQKTHLYPSFRNTEYYKKNIEPNIIDAFKTKEIYNDYYTKRYLFFPLITKFLACQEEYTLSRPRQQSRDYWNSCMVFGYKEVKTGYYEFEYFYLPHPENIGAY